MALTKRTRPYAEFSLGRRQMRYAVRFGGSSIELDSLDERTVGAKGVQTTESEGHLWPPPKGNKDDLGGEFQTTRTFIKGFDQKKKVWPTCSWSEDGPVWVKTYSGVCLPVDPRDPIWYPPLTRSSDALLDAFGATAIALCKPTNSVADASVFLGELLRDGLPTLIGSQSWRERALTAKNAGSEYLNVQFGWLPLIADIKKFLYAISHADEVLAQYERDSGRRVRRRYQFQQIVEEEPEVLLHSSSYGWGSPYTWPFTGGSGRLVRRTKTTIDRWFSGCFTYYLPDGDDYRSVILRNAAFAKKLLGLTITPEVLWNLAPWSWAIDWFTNTGDVLSNLSSWAEDGLVMPYGYFMETTLVETTYTLTFPPAAAPNGWNGEPISITFCRETKVRRKANPFGFGVIWEGLSPRQLSILAALGLSRRGRH